MTSIRLFERMMTTFAVFTVAILCHTDRVESAENPSESNSEAGTTLNGGAIVGTVSFPEEYPKRGKITVSRDHQVCGAFKYSEDFVVSKENHGLQNVVVTVLTPRRLKKASKARVATLNQKGCQYIPHVQAVQVGTVLEILNNDGLLHNIHAYINGIDPSKSAFNIAQPAFLKKTKRTLDKTGVYYFKCDVHDHMSAYIAVMNHPYHAVTNEEGRFTITDIPPGSYKVQAWHEVLGTLEKDVTVAGGKTAEVNFEILPNE